jgi:hypothetical protein
MPEQHNGGPLVPNGEEWKISNILRLVFNEGPKEVYRKGKNVVVGETRKLATWLRFLLGTSIACTFLLQLIMGLVYNARLAAGAANPDESYIIYGLKDVQALVTVLTIFYLWVLTGHVAFLTFVAVGVEKVAGWLLGHVTRIAPRWLARFNVLEPEEVTWVERWQVSPPVDWKQAQDVVIEFLGGATWVMGVLLLLSWFSAYRSFYGFLMFTAAVLFLIAATFGWRREWFWMKYIQDAFCYTAGYIALFELVFTFSLPAFLPWFQRTVVSQLDGFGPLNPQTGFMMYPHATLFVWFVAIVGAMSAIGVGSVRYTDDKGEQHVRLKGKSFIMAAIILLAAYLFGSFIITNVAGLYYGTGGTIFNSSTWSSVSLADLLSLKTAFVVFAGLVILSILRPGAQESEGH